MEQLMNISHGDDGVPLSREAEQSIDGRGTNPEDKEPRHSQQIIPRSPVIDLNSFYEEDVDDVHVDLDKDHHSENENCSGDVISQCSKETGTTSERHSMLYDFDLNLTPEDQFGEENKSLSITSLNNVSRICDSSVQGVQQAPVGDRRIPSYAEKGKMVENGESSFPVCGAEVICDGKRSSPFEPVTYAYNGSPEGGNGAFNEPPEKAVVEILTWMRESDPLRNGRKESERATVLVNEAPKRCNEGAGRAVGAFNPNYVSADGDTSNKRARCLELFPQGMMNGDINLDSRMQPGVPVNVDRIQNPPANPTLFQTHRELEKQMFRHMSKNSPFAPKEFPETRSYNRRVSQSQVGTSASLPGDNAEDHHSGKSHGGVHKKDGAF